MTTAAKDQALAFDYRALWEAIEARRLDLGLTPSGLIKSINWLSAPPLTKLGQGTPTTCQHVVGLLRWLGRTPEAFTPGLVDGPQCRLPDFGAYATRWNMVTLWEAVNEQRLLRGQSWDQVRQETGYPDVETIRLESYGIGMDHAMRVVEWLGRPAAAFMYAAELSPPRPGSAAYVPERAPADLLAPYLVQIYHRIARSQLDSEINDFAKLSGGYPHICYVIMRHLTPYVVGPDREVGLNLGDGLAWTFRRRQGKNSFSAYAKKSANALVHASPADFMRLVFQHLDPDAAVSAERLRVDGDLTEAVAFFRSCETLSALAKQLDQRALAASTPVTESV